MFSRSLATLLALFLAAPLCCCGWHGVVAEEPAVVSCPMCLAHVADASHDSECPCEKELIQRDLAPKTVMPQAPHGDFSALPAIFAWHQVSGANPSRLLDQSRIRTCANGPPRLFLMHCAWLC